MFIRQKRNKSGSVSVQILVKVKGRDRLIKTVGCSSDMEELSLLVEKAKQQIHSLRNQPNLFIYERDIQLESFLSELSNAQVRTIGLELVFERIYDYIGYNTIDKELFRHLVIARLCFPLSKLKTIEYLVPLPRRCVRFR